MEELTLFRRKSAEADAPVEGRNVARVAYMALLALSPYLPSSKIEGQAPMATIADSEMIADIGLRRSFEGIALTKAAQQKAREIIKRTFVTNMLLPRGAPEVNEQLAVLYDQQDSLLLAMVMTATDTVRYLDNSVRMRPPRKKRP